MTRILKTLKSAKKKYKCASSVCYNIVIGIYSINNNSTKKNIPIFWYGNEIWAHSAQQVQILALLNKIRSLSILIARKLKKKKLLHTLRFSSKYHFHDKTVKKCTNKHKCVMQKYNPSCGSKGGGARGRRRGRGSRSPPTFTQRSKFTEISHI